MNDKSLQESLYQFANTLIDANKEPGVQVYECEIIDLVNAGKCIYKVNHLGSIFEAYSNNLRYNIGDVVYVLDNPQTNSRPRMILGISRPNGEMNVTSAKKSSKNIIVNGNILSDDEVYSKLELNNVNEYPVSDYNKRDCSKRFSQALQNYKVFAFKCKILTNIKTKTRRNSGNYGITIKIPFENEIKEFTIDKSNMVGDIYNLNSLTEQVLFFSIGKGERFDINNDITVTAFQENFPTSTENNEDFITIQEIGLYAAIELTEEEMNNGYLNVACKTGNLFLDRADEPLEKEFQAELYLGGDKVNNINNGKYYFYWFKEDAYVNNTSPQYNNYGGPGWSILNKATVTTLEKSGNTVIANYEINKDTLIINANDIHTSLKYKCVLVDSSNDNKTYTKIFEVAKVKADCQISLVIDKYPTGQIPLGLNKINFIATVQTPLDSTINPVDWKWVRTDKTNNEVDVESIKLSESIKYEETNTQRVYQLKFEFPAKLIQDINVFQCSLYSQKIVKVDVLGTNEIQTKNDYQNDFLGKATIVVTTMSGDYTLRIKNGNKLFKYDSDGDSPMVGNYDGPVSNRIHTLTPLEFEIIRNETGQLFTEEEYKLCSVRWKVSKESMIKIANAKSLETEVTANDEFYIVKTPQLAYNIANSYEPNNRNNTIFLEVIYKESFNSIKTFSTSVDMLFTKDGETGNNGGRYAAVITYNGYPYESIDENGVPRKLRLFYSYEDKKWKYSYDNETLIEYNIDTKISFGLNVYRSGELLPAITSTSAKWSMVGTERNEANPICTINGNVITPILTEEGCPNFYKDGQFQNTCTIVKCAVTVGKNSSEDEIKDSEEIIYAYYPIEVIGIQNFSDIEKGTASNQSSFFPLMTGGFSYAMYTSDGVKPQYDSNAPFTLNIPSEMEAAMQFEDDSSLVIYNWNYSDGIQENKIKKDLFPNQFNGVPKQIRRNPSLLHYVRADVTIDNAEDKKEKLEGALIYYKGKVKELSDLKMTYEKFETDLSNALKGFLFSNYEEKLNQLESQNNGLNDLGQLYILNNESWQTHESLIRLIEPYKIPYGLTINGGNSDCFLTEQNINQITTTGVISSLEEVRIDNLDNIPAIGLRNNIKELIIRENNFITQFNILVYQMNNWSYQEQYEELLNSIKEAINRIVAVQVPKDDKYSIIFAYNLKNLQAELSTVYDVTFNIYGAKQQIVKALREVLLKILQRLTITGNSFAVLQEGVFELKDNLKYDFKQIQLSIQYEIEDCNKIINRLNKAIGICGKTIVYIKPILLYSNCNEFSYLSEYDGTKIYTGNNDDYIFAPQVGAAVREEGKLTGMIMGQFGSDPGSTSPQKAEIGLKGYNKGEQTFFLDARSGKAIFGSSTSGQIIIDPTDKNGTRGVIKSANYDEHQGLLIDLTTPQIEFGNGNFTVTKDGSVTMNGTVTAVDGEIGGWNIDSAKIFSTHAGMSSNQGNYAFWAGAEEGWSVDVKAPFRVGHDGGMVSTKGFIGGWTIGENSLYNGKSHWNDTQDKGIYIGTDGIYIGEGKQEGGQNEKQAFWVSNLGEAHATNLVTTGGKIGGWTIDNEKIYSDSAGMSSNKGNYAFWAGLPGGWDAEAKAPFRVGHDGSVVMNQLTANGGTIGGMTIGSTGATPTNGIRFGKTSWSDANNAGLYLGPEGIYLGSGGGASEKSFWISSSDGKIHANAGKIGGFDLTEQGGLNGGDVFLAPSTGTVAGKRFESPTGGLVYFVADSYSNFKIQIGTKTFHAVHSGTNLIFVED